MTPPPSDFWAINLSNGQIDCSFQLKLRVKSSIWRVISIEMKGQRVKMTHLMAQFNWNEGSKCQNWWLEFQFSIEMSGQIFNLIAQISIFNWNEWTNFQIDGSFQLKWMVKSSIWRVISIEMKGQIINLSGHFNWNDRSNLSQIWNFKFEIWNLTESYFSENPIKIDIKIP